jgi:hypothetical protein
MEFTIEFGGDPQDVTITLAGVATPESFRRFNEARLSDERFRKGLVILLDASSLDTSQMSEVMFQEAVEPMLEREANDPPLALAIVAPDARTFKDAVLTRAHLGGEARIVPCLCRGNTHSCGSASNGAPVAHPRSNARKDTAFAK